LIVASVASWGPGRALGAEDALLYYVDRETGQVVITNTPSRPDVRPLPGYAPSGTVRASPTMPATPYDRTIEDVARENGLSPSLIKAVAWVESGFDPHAVSPKGAVGLMQLMPETAARYGVRNLRDPYENLRAGARHLRDLLDEFDGDLKLALAAYNAGAGAVRRHGGVPAYQETREYVGKVQRRLGEGSRRRSPDTAPPASAAIEIVRRGDGTVILAN
jgi:soluble lytic murein transglycosylase-like protein